MNGRHLLALMYTHSSMGWWGPEGLDMGVINVPSIPQPRPTTLFFQGLDGQSGGLSEVHSGMNGGFLVLS